MSHPARPAPINHHHKLEHQGGPVLRRPAGPERGNAEGEESGGRRGRWKAAEEQPA